MNDGDVRLDRVTILILDEADRMLDLGFEPEIRAIAGATRADRQTVMFSATWPNSVQGLAAEFMTNPIKCRIGAEGLPFSCKYLRISRWPNLAAFTHADVLHRHFCSMQYVTM